MITLSIDPGKNGAIVVWEDRTPVAIHDIPFGKQYIDIEKLYNIFGLLDPDEVVIEKVHTAPRAGVASAGNFMFTLGVLDATTICFRAKLEKIPPTTWKATMGMYGLAKIAALGKAETLYPAFYRDNIDPFKNRLDRSEALLIGAAYFKLQGAGK